MNTSSYVELGWKIFPCHSIAQGHCTCRDGAQCSNPGKHPRLRNGVLGASSDPGVVEGWWKQWPDSNIGLACGADSNIMVVDIDQKDGGYDSMDEFEQFTPLPRTLTALSGGGGRHLFFQYPTDGEKLPNRVGWLRGVDIRSEGGYVIISPSLHVNGARYSWENWGSSIMPPPAQLVESIRASQREANDKFSDAIKDSATILDGIPEGQRDDTLFRWACRLRRQHASDADGGLSVVMSLVLQAAEKSGFPEDQARRKVEQAFKQDHSVSSFEEVITTVDDEDEHFEIENMTDVGNRNRFLKLYGQDLNHVKDVGWYRWSDVGWRGISEEEVVHMAEKVAVDIRRDSKRTSDNRLAKQLRNWSMTTEGAGRLAAIERLSRAAPTVRKGPDDFDSVKTELACLNGIVDLHTGVIRPFTRDDLVTKNTNVIYDPDAVDPRWDDFIGTVTQGDAKLMEYLQHAAGYTATGLTSEESFFIISGPKASGKSTYLDGLSAALGEYAAVAQSDTFMFRRGRDTPHNELARLNGVRLVSVSEVREGDSFNEALIKQITGGDKVAARYMYKDIFEFTPQFKLWFGTNHDPIAHDDAMMRRIKRVIFPHTIPEEERKHDLKQWVQDKNLGAQVVLKWVVDGAKEVLTKGRLDQPAVVTMNVEDYQMENDSMNTFILERCEVGDGQYELTSMLWEAWKEHCVKMNEFPGRITSFKNRLKTKGFTTTKNTESGREVFVGVKLKMEDSWIS